METAKADTGEMEAATSDTSSKTIAKSADITTPTTMEQAASEEKAQKGVAEAAEAA